MVELTHSQACQELELTRGSKQELSLWKQGRELGRGGRVQSPMRKQECLPCDP